MKTQILITLVAVVLSNALVLLIHENVFNRKQDVNAMDKYFETEIKRLNERFINVESDVIRLNDGIKKIDTIYQVTQKNYFIRTEERKKMSDSLLNEEWKKFGY